MTDSLLFNQDAENGVLSGLLFDNRNAGHTSELSGKMFSDQNIGKMVDAAHRIIARGEEANDSSVYYELKSEKWVIDKIVNLSITEAVSRFHIESAVKEVKNCYARRTIRSNMLNIAQKCTSEVDIDNLTAFISDVMSNVQGSTNHREPPILAELMAEGFLFRAQ